MLVARRDRVLDRRDVTPRMIGAIHTFGELVHRHPHVYPNLTDGVYTRDGPRRLVPT